MQLVCCIFDISYFFGGKFAGLCGTAFGFGGVLGFAGAVGFCGALGFAGALGFCGAHQPCRGLS